MPGSGDSSELAARPGAADSVGSASHYRRLSHGLVPIDPDPLLEPGESETEPDSTDVEVPADLEPWWKRIPWCWLLLLLVLLLWWLSSQEDEDKRSEDQYSSSSGSTFEGQASNQGSGTADSSGEETSAALASISPSNPIEPGFGMPALEGDVKREFNTRVIWLADNDLGSGATRRLSVEFTKVVEFQKEWAIQGDQSTQSLRSPLEAVNQGAAGLPQTIDKSPASTIALAKKSLGNEKNVGRAIILVSERPETWQRLMAQESYATPDPVSGHAETRLYIVRPVSHKTDVVSSTLDESGPIVIDASVNEPGQIASALAIAWGDNAGARWK